MADNLYNVWNKDLSCWYYADDMPELLADERCTALNYKSSYTYEVRVSMVAPPSPPAQTTTYYNVWNKRDSRWTNSSYCNSSTGPRDLTFQEATNECATLNGNKPGIFEVRPLVAATPVSASVAVATNGMPSPTTIGFYNVWHLYYARWSNATIKGVIGNNPPAQLTFQEATDECVRLNYGLSISHPEFEVRPLVVVLSGSGSPTITALPTVVFNVWNINAGRWTDAMFQGGQQDPNQPFSLLLNEATKKCDELNAATASMTLGIKYEVRQLLPSGRSLTIGAISKATIPSVVKEAASTLAVNDHTCKACGNDRCSKTEKSCWKCGNKL